MKLVIPPGEFAGFIFDLDGTLIDTMPLHYRAWNEAMRRAGLPHELDEEFFYSLGGIPARRVTEVFAKRYGRQFGDDHILREKETLFAELQADAKLITPIVEFARRVATTHPIAVASGGSRQTVQKSLEISGLKSMFPVIVTADDVAHGKPAPDMLFLAARLMKVTPDRCLVFDDAEPGISAAKAAGMQWVRVPSRQKGKPKPGGESAT
jgi:HAD superfamily hydrolase (TIGR01509 family)